MEVLDCIEYRGYRIDVFGAAEAVGYEIFDRDLIPLEAEYYIGPDGLDGRTDPAGPIMARVRSSIDDHIVDHYGRQAS